MARAPNGQDPLSPSNSGALAEAAAAIPITPLECGTIPVMPLESDSAAAADAPSGGLASPTSPSSPVSPVSPVSSAARSPLAQNGASAAASGGQGLPLASAPLAVPASTQPGVVPGASSDDAAAYLQRPSPFSAPVAQQPEQMPPAAPARQLSGQPLPPAQPRLPVAGAQPAPAPVAVPARIPLPGAASVHSQAAHSFSPSEQYDLVCVVSSFCTLLPLGLSDCHVHSMVYLWLQVPLLILLLDSEAV